MSDSIHIYPLWLLFLNYSSPELGLISSFSTDQHAVLYFEQLPSVGYYWFLSNQVRKQTLDDEENMGQEQMNLQVAPNDWDGVGHLDVAIYTDILGSANNELGSVIQGYLYI